ncbi:MAG: polysaccharide biosynthesis protein [Cyclobacteriaceae bacterium]|nr:polysaccharide biosynthesis protein [Cyclobacteriaceae bacterium]
MDKLLLKIKILPRWIIILIDSIILFFSSLLAYLLRFNFDYSRLDSYDVNKGIIIFTFFCFISSLATRSYAGIVRYAGMQDAGRILGTIFLGAALTFLVSYINYELNGAYLIPVSVIIIAFLNAVLFLISYRLFVKQLFSFFWKKEKKAEQVLIYGTRKSAQMARQIIEENSAQQYKVIGYLDDNKQHVGKVVNGVNIFDARKDLEIIINTKSIKELIISERNISIERKNELVDICLAKNIKVRIVPPVEHWVKGELSLNQIKDINIEALLERDSIKLDNYNITEELKGRKVMVTGAAGSIGSEIVRQTLYYNPDLIILVDQAESDLYEIENELKLKKGTLRIYPIIADITSEERMDRIFREFEPQIIFHAAAYKHVPMMEKNPVEAIHCNIQGTKILADLSVKYKAEKFVMISTDKAVNPSNVMGASKRIAEMYVQSLNNYLKEKNPDATKFITTRFGNVLGSNGSVIPVFKKQIDQGGPITVTHPEITRFFMTIPEACQLVLEAGAMGEGGEIFVFDMGKSIRITDLAKKMIQLSGLEVGRDIEIIFTGLRSGEKLYEELLSSYENTLPTYHHKILISKTREELYENVKRNIQLLINSVHDHDELKLVGIMKYIVPEFKSNSSKFEALDKKKG